MSLYFFLYFSAIFYFSYLLKGFFFLFFFFFLDKIGISYEFYTKIHRIAQNSEEVI